MESEKRERERKEREKEERKERERKEREKEEREQRQRKEKEMKEKEREKSESERKKREREKHTMGTSGGPPGGGPPEPVILPPSPCPTPFVHGPMSRDDYAKRMHKAGLPLFGRDRRDNSAEQVCHIIAEANGGADHSYNYFVAGAQITSTDFVATGVTRSRATWWVDRGQRWRSVSVRSMGNMSGVFTASGPQLTL